MGESTDGWWIPYTLRFDAKPSSLVKHYHLRFSYVFYTSGINIILIINTMRPRQNGRHFANDIFKCIFEDENVWIATKISLSIVRKGSINNIVSLVQIMTWRRSGDKPLSEPMIISLLTHICTTRIRCSWCSADRLCSNYIWVINNVIANYSVIYLRGLTVCNFSFHRLKTFFRHPIWCTKIELFSMVNYKSNLFD